MDIFSLLLITKALLFSFRVTERERKRGEDVCVTKLLAWHKWIYTFSLVCNAREDFQQKSYKKSYETWICYWYEKIMRPYTIINQQNYITNTAYIYSISKVYIFILLQNKKACLSTNNKINMLFPFFQWKKKNNESEPMISNLIKTRLQEQTTYRLDVWLSTIQTHWSWASQVIHCGILHYFFVYTPPTDVYIWQC